MKKFLTAFVFPAVLIVLSVSAAELSNFSFDIVFNKEAVSYVRFLDSNDRNKASTISSVKFSLASTNTTDNTNDNTNEAYSEPFYIDYRIYNGETVSILFVPGNATADTYMNDGTMLISKSENDVINKLNYNVEISGIDKKINGFTSGNNNSDVPIGERSIEIDSALSGGVAEPDNDEPLLVSMTVYPPTYTDPETGKKITGFVSGQYTGYAILTITSNGN